MASRDAVRERLHDKASTVKDKHLRNSRLDGWTAAELVQLYLKTIEDKSLQDFAHMVMDLIVLTICARIGTSSRAEFLDEIRNTFPMEVVQGNDFFSRIHLSFDHSVRVPLKMRNLYVWSSRNSKRNRCKATLKVYQLWLL